MSRLIWLHFWWRKPARNKNCSLGRSSKLRDVWWWMNDRSRGDFKTVEKVEERGEWKRREGECVVKKREGWSSQYPASPMARILLWTSHTGLCFLSLFFTTLSTLLLDLCPHAQMHLHTILTVRFMPAFGRYNQWSRSEKRLQFYEKHWQACINKIQQHWAISHCFFS